ncbi:MAG: hypothetical protein ACE5G7_02130 [Candidatus Hydrothermarchaeaceae archaeon]
MDLVKTRPFISESMGQASALDILFFTLLVSMATWMISSYSTVHDADVTMEELRGRYAMDIAQGFVLSARYVTDSRDQWGVMYTVGPDGQCLSDSQGILYRLSETLASISTESPLDRDLRGSPVDLIADDLYLSLGFHMEGRHYSLSNSVLTGCFHERLDSALRKHITFLSGGAFEYRIDASWRPFEGAKLDDLVYSSVSYGDEVVPNDSPIYVSSFRVSVPLDEEGLSNLDKALRGYLDGMGEIGGLIPYPDGSGYEEPLGVVGEIKNASDSFEINEMALVTIKMWPKEAG